MEFFRGKPATGDTPSIPFSCVLKTKKREYRSSYPYFKDHSYCKQKMAIKLLEQWGVEEEDVRVAYSALSKTNVFYRGQIFEEEEGREIEFKGSTDSARPVTETAMMNKSSVIGETICAFLNTNGGTLYYGIHDSTHIIQGVTPNESADKLLLRISGSLKSGLQGIESGDYLHILLHKVIQLQFSDSRALPERPRVLDPYAKALEDENRLLHYHLNKSLVPLKKDLVILEFTVAKHPTVVLYNSIAYQREENSNSKMGFEELKRRIIQEHVARQ